MQQTFYNSCKSFTVFFYVVNNLSTFSLCIQILEKNSFKNLHLKENPVKLIELHMIIL